MTCYFVIKNKRGFQSDHFKQEGIPLGLQPPGGERRWHWDGAVTRQLKITLEDGKKQGVT